MRPTTTTLLVFSLLACGGGEDIKNELQAKIAALESLSREKDELISEVVANTKFMQDLNAEIDRVRRLPAGATVVRVKPYESPIAVAAYRDTVLAHIRELAQRLEQTEARLAAVGARSATATGASTDESARAAASMSQQVETYRATIADARAQLQAQEGEMVSLQEENTALRSDRDQVRAERARLAAEKADLDSRYSDLAESASTVYFIAATKAQLKELGVVNEVGGARGLTLRKRGQTLVPAPTLNPSDLTALSVKGNTEVTMPKPDKAYTLVSPHNAALLSPLAGDGTVRGTVRITDPSAFWATSKFLILVEK